MSRYVKAIRALNRSVVYTTEDGKYFRHIGGTLAWRNHNPGNLRPKRRGQFENQIGAINDFAVFPDYQSGHNALIEIIKRNYWNCSISEMMEKFAPSTENNTRRYIKFLQNFTDVFDNKKIKNFIPRAEKPRPSGRGCKAQLNFTKVSVPYFKYRRSDGKG